MVDGLIGCCGILSLTWVSKNKKEDYHGVCDSLLFGLICHTTMEDSSMDLVTILLPSHVKNFVFALIDCSSLYLYTLTMSLQCISLQRGKLSFGLHGPSLASYYDGDSHLMYDPRQVYGCFLCAQLTYSSIYYLLVGVMAYTASHMLRDHLPYPFLKLQWGRLHCDHLGDC